MRKAVTAIEVLIAIGFVLVLSLPLISLVIGWKAAGVQQQVWERQGVHMTQWEVFIGAKPIQRVLIQEGNGN